jgi:hypothetical protein
MATVTETPATTGHGFATPYGYWLSFVTEWDRLADAAYEAGQDDVGAFFEELADDAGDVWAGFYGPLGNGS